MNDSKGAEGRSPRRGGSHTRNARRRSRELAVQGLYQYFLNPSELGEIDAHIRDAPGFSKADHPHYQALLVQSVQNLDRFIDSLQPHLDRQWSELSPVEKAVLVIGANELLDHLDIPYRVVINESVELSKTFGGTDAHKFVNGVLDKLAIVARAAEIQAS